MIAANMHEAKTGLSELVKAVEDRGESVILQRNGKPVAEIRVVSPQPFNRLFIKPDPALKVKPALGYDPAEPLSDDEWPEACR